MENKKINDTLACPPEFQPSTVPGEALMKSQREKCNYVIYANENDNHPPVFLTDDFLITFSAL